MDDVGDEESAELWMTLVMVRECRAMDDVGDEESAELWMTLVMKRVQSYG